MFEVFGAFRVVRSAGAFRVVRSTFGLLLSVPSNNIVVALGVGFGLDLVVILDWLKNVIGNFEIPYGTKYLTLFLK